MHLGLPQARRVFNLLGQAGCGQGTDGQQRTFNAPLQSGQHMLLNGAVASALEHPLRIGWHLGHHLHRWPQPLARRFDRPRCDHHMAQRKLRPIAGALHDGATNRAQTDQGQTRGLAHAASLRGGPANLVAKGPQRFMSTSTITGPSWAMA